MSGENFVIHNYLFLWNNHDSKVWQYENSIKSFVKSKIMNTQIHHLHFKSNEYFTAIIYNLNLIMVRLLFWKCGAICWRDRAIEALWVELFYEGPFFFFLFLLERTSKTFYINKSYMFSSRYKARKKTVL